MIQNFRHIVFNFCIINIIIDFLFIKNVKAGNNDSIWILQKCIQYALEKNIDIQKNINTSQKNKVSAEQVKAGRLNAFG